MRFDHLGQDLDRFCEALALCERRAHQHRYFETVRIDFAGLVQEIESRGRTALQHAHTGHAVEGLR